MFQSKLNYYCYLHTCCYPTCLPNPNVRVMKPGRVLHCKVGMAPETQEDGVRRRQRRGVGGVRRGPAGAFVPDHDRHDSIGKTTHVHRRR